MLMKLCGWEKRNDDGIQGRGQIEAQFMSLKERNECEADSAKGNRFGNRAPSLFVLTVSFLDECVSMSCNTPLSIIVKTLINHIYYRALAALVLVVAIVSGSAASDIPFFDFEKAKALSLETRRQYDVVFFNDIETWNLDSNRYVTDSFIKRKAEFQQMAHEGYLPAYVALRLLGIWPVEERYDPEALDMLLKQAEAGDSSAMCAILAIPMKRDNWRRMDMPSIAIKFEREGVAKGHGACMAYYGGSLLLGNSPRIKQDRKAAMPLLLESARQGYYVAASRLFYFRYSKVMQNTFDFADDAEVDRALCWGRLAQQHTNWAGFDMFLNALRKYAHTNNRSDLTEKSFRLDPQRIPITERAVSPGDCIRLEQGA